MIHVHLSFFRSSFFFLSFFLFVVSLCFVVVGFVVVVAVRFGLNYVLFLDKSGSLYCLLRMSNICV